MTRTPLSRSTLSVRAYRNDPGADERQESLLGEPRFCECDKKEQDCDALEQGPTSVTSGLVTELHQEILFESLMFGCHMMVTLSYAQKSGFSAAIAPMNSLSAVCSSPT